MLSLIIGYLTKWCEDVTTRGEYYPDKSLARPGVSFPFRWFLSTTYLTKSQAPPLYLHVTSTTKEGLEKAVAKIDELMKQELPNLVDERRFRRREPEQVERDEYGRVMMHKVMYLFGTRIH